MSSKNRKPYHERSDLERLQSNWKKIAGLMHREEWSAAIVRAGTAAEIAANFAVRNELIEKRNLESEFVNHLLKWANGLSGKLDMLLRPLYTDAGQKDALRALKRKATRINEQRNLAVHSGNFMNEQEALEIINLARGFAEELVGIYETGFQVENHQPEI